MKSDRFKQSRDKQFDSLWDAFKDHIDSVYFPGASELLDRQSLAFEYNNFQNYFTGVQ